MSLLHLAVNLYFLMVFGDNVEESLGRGRYLAVLLFAHLAGLLTHAMLDPDSAVPVIGASAGISGVMVSYAFEFPRARIGVLVAVPFLAYGPLPVRWLSVSARFALVAWLLLQIPDLVLQIEGLGRVSAAAHLGGAGAGLVVGLARRLRPSGALHPG